jgi:hypothetical protein
MMKKSLKIISVEANAAEPRYAVTKTTTKQFN